MKRYSFGRRGSAMIQVMIVLTVVLVLAGSMVKLAAFSVRSAERRIRRAQCAVLAESVCATLQAAWSGNSDAGAEPDDEDRDDGEWDGEDRNGGDWNGEGWNDEELDGGERDGEDWNDGEWDGEDWNDEDRDDSQDGAVLPEAGVYDLEIEDFPGELLVECTWEEGDLENPCLSVRVTASVREVSETAVFWYVPDWRNEEDSEDGLD